MKNGRHQVWIVTLAAASLVSCGPTLRTLSGGSRHVAAGHWRLEEGERPGFELWFALDPARTGPSVTVEWPAGFSCETSIGTFQGNRVQFRYFGGDAAITIHSPTKATVVLAGSQNVSYRLRKVGPERLVVCE